MFKFLKKKNVVMQHVYPLNDLRTHTLIGLTCKCKPIQSGNIIVHNAYDGREFDEKITT